MKRKTCKIVGQRCGGSFNILLQENAIQYRTAKAYEKDKNTGKKQTTTQLGLGDNYGVYKWKYQDWETDDTMNEIYALINTNCDNGKY